MKRISIFMISLLTAAVLIISAVSFSAAIRRYIRGDADKDGAITMTDVTLIQRNLADIPTNVFDKIAADIDGKGLDISDATMIQRWLADIYDPFGVGKEATYDEYELPVV